ncbi:MAG: DUF1345 domain-containing protein [Thermoflavifilum sp.]|nr:DUF1345 domain-containing protein [Thermoflavifilum sp.]
MAMHSTSRLTIIHLSGYQRMLIALGVAIITGYMLRQRAIQTWEWVLCMWLGFALSLIALIWMSIFRLHPSQVRRQAAVLDTANVVVFILIILAAVCSLIAIFQLLLIQANSTHQALLRHLWLSVAVISSSWFLVHSMFTLHYAHLYYFGNVAANKQLAGGLDFPDNHRPDYLDFAYFAFCVGMTFQVSDVVVRSGRIHRLVLLHSLISFVFNTVILALMVSLLSGIA